MNDKDTIFAPASGGGRAGVTIIRISGPQTDSVLGACLKGSLPTPRLASLRKLRDPQTGRILDEALVLRFKGPASFTGEDMAELHLHGSPAVVEAVSGVLFSLGLRQAKAGEFTRRAFENGRMDLTEAEGLADLIEAESEGQRVQAYRQMSGGLRSVYEDWRESVLDALAAVEGEIDFPDEEDVPDKLALRAGEGLDNLASALEESLAGSGAGERVRHGLDIAVIGPPNAGKSSLINALSKKEAAIVSDEAGTTRDIVEVNMVIGGLPVRLSDTAGLRDTLNKIEAEGVRRARLRAADADLRIGVVDGSDSNVLPDIEAMLLPGDILVLNKADLRGLTEADVSRETVSVLSLSAHSDEDIKRLREQLETVVAERFCVQESAGLTRARHRACAQSCLTAVQRARLNLDAAPELAGEDLRAALHAIKELAGEADIEAVLDRIFSRFCIGK